MRWRISYEMRVRQRRQQGSLGGAAAPAISARPQRDARGAVSREFRPAFGGDGGTRLCARRVRDHPGCGLAESARGDRQIGRHAGCRATTTSAPSVSSARTSCGARSFSKARQQAARMDHAGADHRPGLHDARLCALRGHGAQSDARGQHLHSGAGLAVRDESHRGADRPRGALRRADRNIRCTA